MIKRIVAVSLFALWTPALGWAQAAPLGPEFQVNTYTSSDQIYPSACSDPAGDFVVVWVSYDLTHGEDGDLAGTFGQRYASNGNPRGTEFQINTYTSDVQAFPAAACTAAGAFVVVWNSYLQDGDSYGVFGQRYDSAGLPAGTEFQVNSYTTLSQDYATVASDGAGNFIVVWASYSQDGDGFGIFGRRYASDGAPLTSEFQVNSWITGTQNHPAIAGNADGSFVVVWTSDSQDGDASGVFAQRFDSSGALAGTEFQVNSYTSGQQFESAIAADANGNFVVAWTSRGNDGYQDGVFAQRFDRTGSPRGTEFLVNTYTSGNEFGPGLAVDATGSFVVVWTAIEYIGNVDITSVVGRQFDASGAALGNEFQVNTYTGYRPNPKVSAQGGGDFVVVWQSYGQEGYESGFGILGRRYVQIGDCNGDGRVTTNELVLAVYIVLDTFPLSDCPAIDGSLGTPPTVVNLVQAVQNSLAGSVAAEGVAGQ